MVKKILLIAVTICLLGKTQGQLDSLTIKRLATSIVDSLNSSELSKEEFGPTKLALANLSVFMPRNNETTAIIRKLLLDKKFKDSQSLFNWLLPKVNKAALESYFFKDQTLTGDEAALIPTISKAVCPCLEVIHKAGFENMLVDSTSIACIKTAWADTALLALYLKKMFSFTGKERVTFIEDFQNYAQIHCDTYFNSLANILINEVPEGYIKCWELYKSGLLREVISSIVSVSQQPIEHIFPTYIHFLSALQNLKDIYKNYDNNYLKYSYSSLIQTDTYEKKSSFIVQYTEGKARILGQAVYDIGIDRPLLYLRDIVFYPREKIQNVEKLEQGIPPLKANNN